MKKFSLKKKILRIILILFIAVSIFFLGYLILKWTGIWELVNSVEKIKEFILDCGFYGRIVFVLLQFLQVTFLPIPSSITTIAGALIYGPFQAGLLSLAGILLGSFVAFALGRGIGRKIVIFMVGEETCEKWEKMLDRAKYSYLIMMLLPFFPDDILSLIAGMTEMSWGFFAFCQFVSRPIGIFTTCYLGSGEIIPYHGWGLAVWGILILLGGLLLYLSTKHKDKIEQFMLKFSKKIKKNG